MNSFIGLSFSRIDADEEGNKKALRVRRASPYPFALDGPRRFLRAPSEEKVAGQGLWPEGLAYRSIRIFDCDTILSYAVGFCRPMDGILVTGLGTEVLRKNGRQNHSIYGSRHEQAK